jgi:hypothetical protein
MNALERSIVAVSTLLLGALFVGVVARRRYRACLSFPIYVLSVFTTNLLVGLWPERFFRWDFYVFKEGVHNSLKFAVALELAARTFWPFPGAVRTATKTVLAILVLVYITAILSTSDAEYDTLVLARVHNGTIWLFSVIAAIVLWYRLPMEPFRKAILVGFVPYLLVFAVGMEAIGKLMESVGRFAVLEGRGRLVNIAHIVAYAILVAYWNYAAWHVGAPGSRAAPAPTDTHAEAH